MNWVRKGFVAFLAFVLLLTLLSGVSAYNVKTKLSQPDKIKVWLAESGLYDRIITAALADAQETSAKDGTNASVSLNNPEVQAAAKSAFNNSLIANSFNKVIDANYSWLSGESSKPEFSIDLTQAKQDFAGKVGDQVTKHLQGLKVCTPEELAKLQIPVDPVAVTCRPASLDPATEGKRISDEFLNSSEFLSTPVLTADNLTQSGNDPGKAYYQNLADLPKVYQLGQNMIWITAIAAIICALGIFFVHPSRRKGARRIGSVFMAAGLLLIATKLVSDTVTNKFEDKLVSGSSKNQLEQPITNFLNTVQSQLTQSNLMFGIIFIVIALTIFVYLFVTREGKPSKAKPRQVNTPDKPVHTPELSSPENRPQPPVAPTDISNRLRSPRPAGPPPLGGQPRRPATSTRPQTQSSPKPRPPKPPRLIQ